MKIIKKKESWIWKLAQAALENDLLKSQVFRYANIKSDSAQMLFLTGLSKDMWHALWTYLKPSRENVLSAKSAAAEAAGRTNAPGAGRKPILDLEDQLLVTMMRLRLTARTGSDLPVWCEHFLCFSDSNYMVKFFVSAPGSDPYLAKVGRRQNNHASSI